MPARGSLGLLWVGAPAFGYWPDRDASRLGSRAAPSAGTARDWLAGRLSFSVRLSGFAVVGPCGRPDFRRASGGCCLPIAPAPSSSRDNLNGRGTAEELPCSASQPEGRRCDRRRGRTSTQSPLPSARNAELGSLPNWERHQVPGAVSATSGSEPAPSRRVTRGVRRPLCRRGVRRPLGRLDCRALSADPFALLLTAAVGVLQHARSHVAAT
jgi:hypothetical protein